MKILIIGGSGFVSGTLAQLALAHGYHVWTVTRGQRPTPTGVTSITADRQDQPAFAQAIDSLNTDWDLVVDCIGFDPTDAEQDIAVFRERAAHLVFVSTDFVYNPAFRQFPQTEESDHFLTPNDGGGSLAYGGKKRACELRFVDGDTDTMAWTVVRPCHIYGPGSLLGCLPHHGRDPDLIAKMQAGETLKLVGGGHFLQQPIFAQDLAQVMLDLHGNPQTHSQIFLTSGPDTVESRDFYRLIADILGGEAKIEEVSVSQHLATHPESAPFMCHRIYDMGKLAACGVALPSTPLDAGLQAHVESLLPQT